MASTVADIIKIMERLAPSRLAEEWDNPGLQVGQKDWHVNAIWVALDPLPEVVSAACQKGIDLLITHHPLILKPLKSIDFSTPAGSIIQMATQHQLAIFSAHTNLDIADGGVNDILARKIGLNHLKPLEKIRGAGDSGQVKLAVYVPPEYEQKILNALFDTAAGRIGEYTCCSFRSQGKGTFRPEEKAKPFLGKTGEISHTDEIRIETVVPKDAVAHVIERIRETHPYETAAYDVYPLFNPETPRGIGRIGMLPEPTDLTAFALRIKEKLRLKSLKIAGKPDLPVRKAALCGGSGSGLMKRFFSSDAQVYISGDLRYHDARDAEAAGRGLIDIGHFASEYLIVEALAEHLGNILSDAGQDITAEACELEADPFTTIL
jgi:dinuclear metal center YbgI/SA1388 family protein